MTHAGQATPDSAFAHSGRGDGRRHLLREHLQAVAELSRRFAADFGAGDWGYAAGLWHDLGKYSQEFQAYLREAGSEDYHRAELSSKVDHTSAGAKHAACSLDVLGHLLAYAIAGHHAGLLDAVSEGACMEKRLRKEVFAWEHGLDELPGLEPLSLPDFLNKALSRDRKEAAFSFSFFVRMIFSCLVDADYLDTENFYLGCAPSLRSSWPDDILGQMNHCLDQFVQREYGTESHESLVRRMRSDVRQACLAAAQNLPGLFSLTVPTGGGKTLASLAFGLRHALRHGMRRIVYVVPFTSIIDQNVKVFRDVFAPLEARGIPDPVVEHHSTLDPERETDTNRLAAENWDAPLVVSTTVQFYESLFANRPGRCRKLHNLARAVVILDEAHKVPVDYLRPCLTALRELANHYGSTVVLCTATQPAVHLREDFPIGLDGIREIYPEPRRLYLALKRVRVADLGRLSDADLRERLASQRQVLCVVNTRRHARDLYLGCRDLEGVYHLSAGMCPAHRSETLDCIKAAVKDRVPCRVISTQVVEAGVDLDFPVVYRSLAGIDSIAQAAGRCNRNGELSAGLTYVFRSEHGESEAFLRDTTNAAAQLLGGCDMLPLYDDILSLEAVEHYFRLYYWTQKDRWDRHGILQKVRVEQNRKLPFLFDFESISRHFRVIGDQGGTVLIPWGEQGRSLCERLRYVEGLIPVSLARALQRYAVQVPRRSWIQCLSGAAELIGETYAVLPCVDPYYHAQCGLWLEVETYDPEVLTV